MARKKKPSPRATNRQKTLWRQYRVGLRRFADRLARRNKRYDPNKSPVIQHKVRLNDAFTLRESEPGQTAVSSPTFLDFTLHARETIEFFASVRDEILRGKKHNVLIDLVPLEEISPPAAVVLLAEITRCTLYARTNKRLQGNYPKGERARQMLGDIGFFRAFNIKTPPYTVPPSDRVYVHAACGNRSDGRYTRPFLALFDHVANFSPIASKRLYAALIECMDNVRTHAYEQGEQELPDVLGEWWICGFADPLKRQLALVFYDQGRGIPTTIKRKRSIRIRTYVNFSDSKILKRAVMLGLSSTSSARRGTGLPSLREFVDYAPGGFLRVISGNGDFTYRRNPRGATMREISPRLEGSLIVWEIQGTLAKGVQRDASELALGAEDVQLRFDYGNEP